MDEPRRQLDYGHKRSGVPASTASLLIKLAVVVVGAILLLWLARWRLFGNSDF